LENYRLPISLEDTKIKFDVENLDGKINYLLDKRYLLPFDYDEELEYLSKSSLSAGKKNICTENFIIFYPEQVIFPIPLFADLLEKVYANIIKRGFNRLSRRSIVFICEKKSEFEFLWGQKIPPGLEYFVAHGRIIAVKPNKIYSLAIADESVFKVMTHEIIHIILYENYTNLPIWCTEGLCEYYSKNTYSISFQKLVQEKGLMRFSEMTQIAKHSILDVDKSTIENNIGYRQSVSFINYLIDLLGEDRVMKCVMSTGLANGFKKRFKEHFSHSLEHYEEEWRSIVGIGSNR
jgi:hypothetical protein